MHKVGDFIIYKKDVYKIKEIKEIKNIVYYVLNPIDDETLKVTIPSDSIFIRNIISKTESEKIINLIPSIDIIEINDKLIENEYKKLLNSGNLEDLIKIIKTTYLRNEERTLNNKKISEKDNNYFNKAERLLYNELSISLGLNYEETKNYIKESVEKVINEKKTNTK